VLDDHDDRLKHIAEELKRPVRVSPSLDDRVMRAVRKLQCLGDELNFTNAAAAQFHVMARDRHAAVTGIAVDLALDGMDVLDGGVVQIFAPDEGL